MTFYELARQTISQRLLNRDTLPKVIDKIRTAAELGKVAFYPCGRYSRIIIEEIKRTHPELLNRIVGCFDKSRDANMEKGVGVYHISDLNAFKDEIALLVVASNTFYANELKDIKAQTDYTGPVHTTSRFDITIELTPEEALARIEQVYHALADEKSRMTYLLIWLSRLLNDEAPTMLFEGEEPTTDYDGEKTLYKQFVVEGIDDWDCRKELDAEIYRMRYVAPEPGDVVLDIGAYKGDTAVFFADSVGETGKVYSFEPVKANYRDLLKTIEGNELRGVVVPINKGCSKDSGAMRATSSSTGAAWSFLSQASGGEEVRLISVDEFVESEGLDRVDFIKMDVEGMEEEVIAGMERTVNRFRPKLAIPLYHRASDLTNIPLIVEQLGGYDMYIRCKVEGPYGINLYCISKNSLAR